MTTTKSVVSIGLVIVVWGAVGLLPMLIFSNTEDRGTFGDMFGAVNALFAGLAFLGVIYAILLQRQELALQRAELQLTRKELGRSANAQESSSKAMHHELKVTSLTAKLSAYSALIQSCNDQISSTYLSSGGSSSQIDRHINEQNVREIRSKRAEYEERLQEVIKQIEAIK